METWKPTLKKWLKASNTKAFSGFQNSKMNWKPLETIGNQRGELMTGKQEAWINDQIDAMKTIMKTFFAGGTIPSDEEWEMLDNMQSLILKRTKGNGYVRKAFLDLNEELSNIEIGVRNDKKM